MPYYEQNSSTFSMKITVGIFLGFPDSSEIGAPVAVEAIYLWII